MFVVLATTLPFTYKVATPEGVTVTLKYCQVLSWIAFVAVSSTMLLPLATKNVRSFVVKLRDRTMLSLFTPFPNSKYRPQLATDDVYAHTPALKPCEKSRKPALGSWTEVLTPSKVIALPAVT